MQLECPSPAHSSRVLQVTWAQAEAPARGASGGPIPPGLVAANRHPDRWFWLQEPALQPTKCSDASGADQDCNLAKIRFYKERYWLDISTRAVEVEAVLYNGEHRLYGLVKLTLTFQRGGSVVPTYSVRVLPVWAWGETREYYPDPITLDLLVACTCRALSSRRRVSRPSARLAARLTVARLTVARLTVARLTLSCVLTQCLSATPSPRALEQAFCF